MSTGCMMQVANIPLDPPIKKGWMESRNLSVEDLGASLVEAMCFYYERFDIRDKLSINSDVKLSKFNTSSVHELRL